MDWLESPWTTQSLSEDDSEGYPGEPEHELLSELLKSDGKLFYMPLSIFRKELIDNSKYIVRGTATDMQQRRNPKLQDIIEKAVFLANGVTGKWIRVLICIKLLHLNTFLGRRELCVCGNQLTLTLSISHLKLHSRTLEASLNWHGSREAQILLSQQKPSPLQSHLVRNVSRFYYASRQCNMTKKRCNRDRSDQRQSLRRLRHRRHPLHHVHRRCLPESLWKPH